MSGPRYWYEFWVEECVLCGRTDSWKQRRTGPKPKDHNKRHHFRQAACGQHFL